MSARPVDVQVIGSELALRWPGGDESYFPLELLRKSCPCATCGGEPDVLGRVIKPNVTYNEHSFEIKNLQLIGGYALQPTWADGHSTGLYSWSYLQKLDAWQKEQAG